MNVVAYTRNKDWEPAANTCKTRW